VYSLMCLRCRDLRAYTWEMSSALANDYAIRQAIEDRAKTDVINNAAFLVTGTGSAIAAFKAGLGNGVVNIAEAAAIGFGVSSGILARKKIGKAFVYVGYVGKSVCRHLNRNLTVTYLEYATRERIRTVSRVMKTDEIKGKLGGRFRLNPHCFHMSMQVARVASCPLGLLTTLSAAPLGAPILR
jgi:hypothetical protein